MTSAPKTILIINDEEDERIIYSAVLHYFGYRVVEATTGGEGLELAAELKPDLILLDVKLPDVDGLSVARALKKQDGTHGISIISCTLHDMHASTAHEAGCDHFMKKPFSPTVLVREVERLIGPPSAAGIKNAPTM